MYKILETHTADIGLEVKGQTLEELFIEAARGWKQLVLEDAQTQPIHYKAIQLTATDIHDLLVQWLSELNYLLTVQQWVVHDVPQLTIQKTSDQFILNAKVAGEPFDPNRHYVYFDIKAVTYHQLDIKYQDGFYNTRIIFDI